MKISNWLINRKNYGDQRDTKNIKYIVIHYTANDGDSDTANAKYFTNNVVKASAHYFVDNDSITQTVPDNMVAYSVGGNRYSNYKETGGASHYKKCTNANSISIELCDSVKDGKIYPTENTIKQAVELTRELMAKYNIPKDNVIRHFDVTGKSCPLYWCGSTAKNVMWRYDFWDKLTDFQQYKVMINTEALNVRTGAGVSNKKVMEVTKGEIFTIVDEKNGWGKLKSGVGWISLKYTVRLK